MSGRLILVEGDAKQLRAALIEDRRLTALEIDRFDRPTRVGSVLPAKIIRTVRGLGAFVRLPDGSEMLLDREPAGRAAGEALPIQILREPRGAKLGLGTASITLAGRALIHLPLESGVTISRRAEMQPERRAALQSLLAGKTGGWILRRKAGALADADIEIEASALESEGRGLGAANSSLPAPDAFRRLMADHGLPNPTRIVVAGRGALRTVERWSAAFAPDLSSRVGPHGDPGSLFDAHDLDEQIALLSESWVALPEGGSLAIERTEALTVIDVNAGAEPNALNTNLVAAKEIARQLVLRHIGGIVVIDFVSLPRPADRDRTVRALKESVANDSARTHILPMSAFGLVEMTRERRGPGLELDP